MLTSQKLTLKDICRSDVVSDLYLVWRTHFQLVQYQTAWALEKSFFLLSITVEVSSIGTNIPEIEVS